MPYQCTRNGLINLAVDEAVVTIAYPDGTHQKGELKGQTKYSIGIGRGGAKKGDTMTFRECFADFILAVSSREKELSKRITAKLKPHEFDALFSLYYNNGNRQHFSEIVAKLNDSLIDEALDLWLQCDRPEGTDEHGRPKPPHPGLRKRREHEINLFRTADYGELSTLKVWHGAPFETNADGTPKLRPDGKKIARKPDELYSVQPTDFVR